MFSLEYNHKNTKKIEENQRKIKKSEKNKKGTEQGVILIFLVLVTLWKVVRNDLGP